jgi:hypothetical protein
MRRRDEPRPPPYWRDFMHFSELFSNMGLESKKRMFEHLRRLEAVAKKKNRNLFELLDEVIEEYLEREEHERDSSKD